MLHESCRAIVSAADSLRAYPLPDKAKDLLATIVRHANDAAGEIEYLQTSANSFREDIPIAGLPQAYFDLGLSPRRLEMLSILYAAKGAVVSYGRLMAALYGNDGRDMRGKPRKSNFHEDSEALPNILKVYCSHTRKQLAAGASRLEAEGLPSAIQTVWAYGYRLVHESQVMGDPLRGRINFGRNKNRHARTDIR